MAGMFKREKAGEAIPKREIIPGKSCFIFSCKLWGINFKK